MRTQSRPKFEILKNLELKIVLSIIVLSASLNAHGQTSHYWTNQVGARSTMLGGSMVGNVRDNSAIYYNPGGMAFTEKASISADGDAIYLDFFNHENGAGEDVDMESLILEAIPSALIGSFKSEKRPWLTMNYALMNKNASKSSFNAQYSGVADVMSDHPGDENYLGTYSFSNETREDWVILGRGYKVSERLGLGISTVIAFLSQKQSEKYNISTFVPTADGSVNELGYNINETDLNYSNIGLLFKVGWSYEFDKLRIGGNITTPRLSILAVSKAYINRNNQVSVSPYTDQPTKKSFTQDKIPVQYKSPWIFDLGISYPISKKGVAFITVAYFSKIKKYDQLKGNVELSGPEEILDPSEENYSAVFQAYKPIFNIAIGYEHRLNDHYSVLTGFRTDFNYSDLEELDEDLGYISTFSNYTLYHLTGGIGYTNKTISLNVGIISAFGKSSGNEQLVNLIDPKDENLLLGNIGNTVNSSFLRLGVVLGLTFFFTKS